MGGASCQSLVVWVVFRRFGFGYFTLHPGEDDKGPIALLLGLLQFIAIFSARADTIQIYVMKRHIPWNTGD